MLWVCQREAVRHTHPYGFIVTWEVWGLDCKILMYRTHFGLVVKIIGSITVFHFL